MAKLDRIVNVAISLNTTAIKEQNFSDILILGAHALAVNRVMAVTEAGELLDMGIAPNDPLYIAVRDAFKQIPTVARVFVGRRQVDASRIAVTRAAASDYAVSLSWRDANGIVQKVAASVAGAADSTPQTLARG
ncbi:hypothetical protein ACNPP0_29265, partial [Achromobacter sp. AGC39]